MTDLKLPDINSVTIAGHLTCDPSFRKTTNGTPVANFYVASNRKFKDNNGQWRENVCYVGVVAWYKLAESCYENLKRGSAVLIDGELQSRNWRNEDGTTRNVVEIKARRVQFLNKKLPSEEDLGEGQFVSAEVQEEDTYSTPGRSEREVKAPPAASAPPVKPEEEPIDTSEFDFGYQSLKL